MAKRSATARRPVQKRQSPPAPERPAKVSAQLKWLLAAGLLTVTFLTYLPMLHCSFVNFDDTEYVTQNRELRRGLTWSGIQWAFTAVVSCNWHPLTLLSLLVDHAVFGPAAWGYHFHNLLLHLANTFLLLCCLRLMTGALWRSAVVAALFALHPLHVESVAWISERKDLLSTLFGLLALRAYLWHVAQPGWRRMAAVTALLLLSLLAKPMWVTFPFLLLLLDFWPLRREQNIGWARLIIEKVPLLILVGVFSAITMLTQVWQGRTFYEAAQLSFLWRGANAFVSYVQYLRQTFWPMDLAVFYVHPGTDLGMLAAVGAVLLIGIISVLAFGLGAKAPYGLVGWGWYVGMLVPVIGFVQVGEQARADRYTYVPLVGVFMMLTWGAADLLERWGKERRHAQWAGGVLAGAVLLGCILSTSFQVACWKNSAALWEQALHVTSDNLRARVNYGRALVDAKRPYDALKQYDRAIELKPRYAPAYLNRGIIYRELQRPRDALADFQRAIDLEPSSAEAHNNRGSVLLEQGDTRAALADFSDAIKLWPEYPEAHNNRGKLYQELGQRAEALRDLDKAIEQKRDYADAYNNRGTVHQELASGPRHK